jgi:hypothetical protein
MQGPPWVSSDLSTFSTNSEKPFYAIQKVNTLEIYEATFHVTTCKQITYPPNCFLYTEELNVYGTRNHRPLGMELFLLKGRGILTVHR